MRCSKCTAENREGRKFCAECGAPLKARCASCGAENDPAEKFCGECGVALAGKAQTVSAAAKLTIPEIHLTPGQPDTSTAPEGERKTVTALFADIKGSTELMRDLDPEAARAIVDPVLHLMMEAVHRYGGYVAQSTGDGIFALFGAPIAHEDHPQRALHAALAMQEELRRYADRLRADGRIPVEARVGVNTGEVVVRTIETGGHTEYTPVGHVTNLAARMQTAAPEGSIAASEATQRLCEGYFEFRALGPTAVKGLNASVEVYEVVRAGPLRTHFQLSTRRGLTRFVGREREMAAMAGALEQARASHGQIVAAVGEAGAGKSRLMYEFKASIPDGCKLLEAYSVSHGKASAWLPVLELLRSYFEIAEEDDDSRRSEKVGAKVNGLDPALAETLPYILSLLGIAGAGASLAMMDAQIKRRRTLDAVKRIIVRESLKQPLVVIFEDLHWVDSETQALLDLLADSGAGARLLLLVNYRPEYRHEWSGRGHYLQLRLDPLGGEHGAAMLAALLGGGVELEALKRLIIERTEGNPFFIEEMVQALFDEGALVRNGAVKVARSLSQLRLPPTVQGILASRIDRLSVEQKELLQTLAVIGRESPLGLIRKVADKADPQLERMLADLRAAEFIYERPALTDAEYIFKHALTQEVAYNSLLIGRRKLLHERAGHALESLFAEQLDDHLGELAHHYSHSDNVAKAVEYLGRAGRQALQRSAHTAAIGSLTEAIDLLSRLPDGTERIRRELQLQLVAGPALSAIKGWSAPEVERAYFRARELCKRLGDPPELFPTLVGVWLVYYIRGESGMAYELAEQLMNRAQSRNDSTHLLLAHDALGSSSFEMGKLLLARAHKEAAIFLYDPARHGPSAARKSFDAKGYALSFLGMALWSLGYPDQALKRANEAVEFSQALSHPLSMAGAEFFLGVVQQYRHEARAAQKAAERAIALSAEHGFTFWLALATILRGWAMAQQGLNEQGIAQMEEGLAAFRATGAGTGRPHWLSLLAEACIESGRLQHGQSVLAEAQAFANETEGHGYDAEIYRLKGELLRRTGDFNAPEAQKCFERAIEIARNESAKSFELRATTSLGRLLSNQGRRDEARAMLAAIYNWFTEGFDTADLKDAKALLDELNE
jgi:class 3 adenylate cyclase/predicted ATPase